MWAVVAHHIHFSKKMAITIVVYNKEIHFEAHGQTVQVVVFMSGKIVYGMCRKIELDQIFPLFGIQVSVPVIWCSIVPVIWCSIVPVIWSSSVPVIWSSSKGTHYLVFKRTRHLVFKRTRYSVVKRTRYLVVKRTRYLSPRVPVIQSSRVPIIWSPSAR